MHRLLHRKGVFREALKTILYILLPALKGSILGTKTKMTEQRSNLPENCNLELPADQSIWITYTEKHVLSKFQTAPLILLRVHILKAENSKVTTSVYTYKWLSSR